MARHHATAGLLLGLALICAPLAAHAQPKGDPKGASSDEKGDPKAAAGEGEGEGGEGEGEGEGPEGPTEPDDGGGLAEICKIDPDACPKFDPKTQAEREVDEEKYAVQQIYFLRAGRFEINPYWGLTMNDQFVAHPGPGVAFNYYITNAIAVGANANVYAGLNSESDFNFETGAAARIGLPLTEYQWNANANFTYVPAYGKFAGGSEFIFHYDLYVTAGVGAISTRPRAVIDPDNRVFSFEPTVTFGAGIGTRIAFTRFLAVVLEIRDYIFFDRIENPTIATGFDAAGKPRSQDDTTWLQDSRQFTNNVQAQLGLSLFLPPTWDYTQPK
ncbi:MAG: outer membrane beta-barrel domain-containing protein [Polyangiaceae bacterium]|nr:outer membrane beta-barrel domain-containing protein [Polyangiaceae bacterium]